MQFLQRKIPWLGKRTQLLKAKYFKKIADSFGVDDGAIGKVE